MSADSGDRLHLRNLVLLLVAALIVFGFKAAPRSVTSDFHRYWHAGVIALYGGDIYGMSGGLQFKYFPCFAQLMAPFALMPVESAAVAWYMVLCASYLGMLRIVTRMATAPEHDERRMLVVGFAALVASSRFFVDNARLGQINMPVAFLAFAGTWCVFSGRERAGGALTALGACLKFMPVVLLGYFAWKRRWRAVAWGTLCVFLFVFILPVLTWGWDAGEVGSGETAQPGIFRLLGEYVASRSKMVSTVPKTDSAGQSVPALLNRFLRPVVADRHEGPRHVNVADLSIGTVNTFVVVVVVLLVVGAMWVTRKRRGPDASPLRIGLEIGVVLVLMLLISPEARRAHFITLLWPAGMVAACVHPDWKRRPAETALFVSSLLCTLGTSSDLIGDVPSEYLNAYGVVALGAIFLLAANILCLRRLDAEAEADEGDDSAAESAAP